MEIESSTTPSGSAPTHQCYIGGDILYVILSGRERAESAQDHSVYTDNSQSSFQVQRTKSQRYGDTMYHVQIFDL